MFWHNINKKRRIPPGQHPSNTNISVPGHPVPLWKRKQDAAFPTGTHTIHLQTEVRQRCTERHSCIQRLQRSVVSLADHLGRSIEIYFHTTIRLADRPVLNRVGAAKALHRTNLTASNAPPLQVRRHRLGTTL